MVHECQALVSRAVSLELMLFGQISEANIVSTGSETVPTVLQNRRGPSKILIWSKFKENNKSIKLTDDV